MRRTRIVPALVMASVCIAAACTKPEPQAQVPPPKVPAELAPQALSGGTYSLAEDAEAKEVFASAPSKALIADGRLWAIRRGTTLVGTLQISTVKNKVDLTEADVRDSIISGILTGAKTTIPLEGIDVSSLATEDKTVYLWFGEELFEVLQVKGRDVDPEAMLSEIISYQRTSGLFRPADV